MKKALITDIQRRMTEYNFICPIGESCIASHNLRENLLQTESYPFDWLMDCKLDNFIHYIQTDFRDFLLYTIRYDNT
jgi:hypothetical protein